MLVAALCRRLSRATERQRPLTGKTANRQEKSAMVERSAYLIYIAQLTP